MSNQQAVEQCVGTDEASWCARFAGSRWSLASPLNAVFNRPRGNQVFRKAFRPANLLRRVAAIISHANIYGNILAAPAGLALTWTGSLWLGNRYRLGMRGAAHNSRLSNNALHLTRRRGVAASRPVVEGRLAGERECSTGVAMPSATAAK